MNPEGVDMTGRAREGLTKGGKGGAHQEAGPRPPAAGAGAPTAEKVRRPQEQGRQPQEQGCWRQEQDWVGEGGGAGLGPPTTGARPRGARLGWGRWGASG